MQRGQDGPRIREFLDLYCEPVHNAEHSLIQLRTPKNLCVRIQMRNGGVKKRAESDKPEPAERRALRE